MGKVAVELLEPGMIIASDVRDRSGRMLLGAGSELTAKHVFIFRTWGVTDADIQGVEAMERHDDLPPEVDPAELKTAMESLEPLFCHANLEHPAMAELLRIAAFRKVRHAAK